VAVDLGVFWTSSNGEGVKSILDARGVEGGLLVGSLVIQL
jgi:hypothetical protein